MINVLFSLANFSFAVRFYSLKLQQPTTAADYKTMFNTNTKTKDIDQDQDKDQETKTKTTTIHVLCYFSFFDTQENTVF